LFAVGRLVALLVTTVLVPWCVMLWWQLPVTEEVPNWRVGWVGLDGAVAVTAAASAFLLRREDPRAALPVTATGTLLLLDAWFDICTSRPGPERVLAVVEGAVAELPLACGAIGLALVLTGWHR